MIQSGMALCDSAQCWLCVLVQRGHAAEPNYEVRHNPRSTAHETVPDTRLDISLEASALLRTSKIWTSEMSMLQVSAPARLRRQ